MDNFQQLWQLVQQVVPGAELEPATLQLELEQYRSKLLNLFHNKVNTPRSHASCSIQCCCTLQASSSVVPNCCRHRCCCLH
jgi:hypothetical protein